MIGFDKPVVVNDTAESGDVDEPVKGLPVFPTETTNPAFCGSDRERNQKHEAEEPDSDERALGDVFPHSGEIEGLVRTDVGEEMQADVSESEKTQHAAEADEVGEIEDFAKRSDGEGDEQEAESPIAGEVLQELDGIGAELATVGTNGEEAERGEASKKDDRLGPFCSEDLTEEIVHVSSIS